MVHRSIYPTPRKPEPIWYGVKSLAYVQSVHDLFFAHFNRLLSFDF